MMDTKEIKISLRSGNPSTEQVFTYVEFKQHVYQLIDQALYASAASFALQVARTFPEDVDSRLLAAQSLLMDRRPMEAIEPAEQALGLIYDRPQETWASAELIHKAARARVLESHIALQMNNHAEAVHHMNAALALEDSNADIHCDCGILYLAIGDTKKASEHFICGMKLDIRNVSNWLKLSDLPKFEIPDKLLRRMEFLVQSRQLPPDHQVSAHFALANIYDKRADIKSHFRHLHAGNELVCKSYQYDPRVHEKDTTDIINFFSTDFYRKHEPFKRNEDKLIFVIGLPRSGSTLVEQILCSHPMVSDSGESAFLVNSISNFANKYADNLPFPDLISAISYNKLQIIADQYLDCLSHLEKSPVVVDKTLGNYYFIGLLSLLFPKAKFVDTRRHPVANLYGCYKRLFVRGSITHSYNLHHLVARYKDYRRMMDHWEQVLPGKVYALQYEKLVCEQERTTRELLRYCELPWDERCLNFHQNRRTVLTSSNAQVREKLYDTGLDKWKSYAAYLGPLLELATDDS
jgi:tetratricopeptide (TPR) repeat protein